MKVKKMYKQAFSLIEIIVALILFALLMAIGIPKLSKMLYNNSVKAQAEKILNSGRQIAQAVIAYKTEKGAFPANLNELLPSYLDEIPSVKIGSSTITPSLNADYLNFGNNTKKDFVVEFDGVPQDVCQKAQELLPGKAKCDTSSTTNTLYYLIVPDYSS